MAPVTDSRTATPYVGLRHFDEEQSHLFFGREAQITDILDKLRRARLVTVMGSSGSGKSSLVRAGVIPRLRVGLLTTAGTKWRVVKIRPGSSPIASLSRGLELSLSPQGIDVTLRRGPSGLAQAVEESRLPTGTNVLVVADQFEELFRFNRSSVHIERGKEEASAFVKLLLEASAQQNIPIFVIVTMRSDYLGNCTQFRDLPERINKGIYLVPRMRRDQLEQAIRGPAAVEDAEVTPRLLQRLLNESGDDPDQLPVLQHSLLRTWNAWNHATRAIDLQDLEAVGGMRDGLSRHAEEIFARLSDGQKRIARTAFQQLSERDAEGRDVRRPAAVAGIAAIADVTVQAVEDTLKAFVEPQAALIYRNEEGLFDITHESLIRKWTRVQGSDPGTNGWMSEEADARGQFLRLLERTERNDPLSGRALDEALQWRALGLNDHWSRRYTRESSPTPTHSDVLTFIETSKSIDVARRSRRRWLVFGAGTCIVAALVSFIVLWIRANEARTKAEQSQREAERQGRAARIQLALGGADIVRLGEIAGESLERWDHLPAQLTPEFIERLDHQLLTRNLSLGDSGALKRLLDVIDRGHPLLVSSPAFFGAMTFALEEASRRSVDDQVKARSKSLLPMIREAFIAYHKKTTPKFKEPPERAAMDGLTSWVRVEGGEFMMGAEDITDAERPLHSVRVSPFSMQQHEVTNEEYVRFDPTHRFPPGQERHPVVNVSWYEAVAYAAWLGAAVPTEAQWEFAARGSDGTSGRRYPWGTGAPNQDRAVYDGGSAKPVGSRPPGRTPQGVADMAGNVWEWCRDWYGPYSSAAESDPFGPMVQNSGNSGGSARRVMRGGAFNSKVRGRLFEGMLWDPLRAANRDARPPQWRAGDLGFRLVSFDSRP